MKTFVTVLILTLTFGAFAPPLHAQEIKLRQSGVFSRTATGPYAKGPKFSYKIEGMDQFRRLSLNAKEIIPLLKNDKLAFAAYQKYQKRRRNANIWAGLGVAGMIAGVLLISSDIEKPNRTFHGLLLVGGSFVVPFTVRSVLVRNTPKLLQRSVRIYNENKGYVQGKSTGNAPQAGLLIDAEGIGLGFSF